MNYSHAWMTNDGLKGLEIRKVLVKVELRFQSVCGC